MIKKKKKNHLSLFKENKLIKNKVERLKKLRFKNSLEVFLGEIIGKLFL